MVQTEPDVIVVETGSPNMFSTDLNIESLTTKISRFLPRAKIVLLTELSAQDPFVQAAIKKGVSVIGEGIDYPTVVQRIYQMVCTENPFVLYPARDQRLEGFPEPHW